MTNGKEVILIDEFIKIAQLILYVIGIIFGVGRLHKLYLDDRISSLNREKLQLEKEQRMVENRERAETLMREQRLRIDRNHCRRK